MRVYLALMNNPINLVILSYFADSSAKIGGSGALKKLIQDHKAGEWWKQSSVTPKFV